MPDGPSALALAIRVNQRFLNSRTKQQARAWMTLAKVVDVECAAINRQGQGPDVLTVRLNAYVETLVLDRSRQDQTKAVDSARNDS
jgi:hypothetical protein